MVLVGGWVLIPLRQPLLWFLFYRWRNWSLGWSSSLPSITKWKNWDLYLNSMILRQRSANFFYKGPDGMYFRLWDQMVTDASIQLWYCRVKSTQQYFYEWAWLSSNEIYLQKQAPALRHIFLPPCYYAVSSSQSDILSMLGTYKVVKFIKWVCSQKVWRWEKDNMTLSKTFNLCQWLNFKATNIVK